MNGYARQPPTIIALLFSIFMLTGCSLFDDDEPSYPSPASCSSEDYNQYVYDVMKRFYYWYNEVDPSNQVNPKDTIAYPTPKSLIDALRYTPLDRFSGVTDAASFNQLFDEGEFIGVGLRLMTDELTDNLMVTSAITGSPAALAGISRGDRLVTINGNAANGLSGDDWTAAWGPREIGYAVTLEIEYKDGTPDTIDVNKAVVSIDTTQASSVINTPDGNIGYLHFTNFLNSTSIKQLDTQFENFTTQNVSELIVDLRYNGGGSVNTARYLGSLIGGGKTTDTRFTQMIYNNKPNGYDGYTVTLNFSEVINSLNLNRVFFITSGGSCSASELLINSLLPDNGIDVVVVGSATCGKPVGSQVQTECGKSLAVINFEIRNTDNQGQYFDGISASYDGGLTDFCEAEDDINNPLGDSNESSLAAAMDYISNGQCGAAVKTGMKLKSLTANRESSFTVMEELY